MYSISNFQVCDIVLLIIATMLYIKLPKLDSSHNWKFELFDQYLPIYLTSQSQALYTFHFSDEIPYSFPYCFPLWLY